MKPEKILERVTVVSLYIAVLLLPVFFTTLTTEWVEWNKHYLLGILVVVSLLAWLGHGLITKKLTINRTPFDLPLLVWWVAVLVSAILAKNQIAGFFGQATNVSWGSLALTFYILLTFLILWNIRAGSQLKNLLDFLGIGIGLSAIYFWLYRFGLLAWLGGPASNPSSAQNVPFGILQVFLLVLALGVLLIPKLESRRAWLWGVLAALALITVTGLGFDKLWIASSVGLFLLLLLSFPRLAAVRYPIVSLTMVLFVLSLVFLILGTPDFLTVRTNAEVKLSHQRSLQITIDTLKEGPLHFIFGSGPGTFVYDFSAHRPASFNVSPLWAVRFSRPGAVSYMLLAETGILGTVAAFVILLLGLGTVTHLWWSREGGRLRARVKDVLGAGVNAEETGFFVAIGSAWLTSAVMLFFEMYGTALWVFFFVTLALLVLFGQQIRAVPTKEFVLSFKTTPQYALATSFIYIVVVAAVVIGGIFLGRFYAADAIGTRAARAANAGDLESSEALLTRATVLNPYRARYQRELANVYLGRAAILSRTAQPDQRQIGGLVGNAINATSRATTLDPMSVAAWEQLADMYESAIPFAKEAASWAVSSLNEALKHEPNNPRLYARRGLVYRLDKNLQAEAVAEFEKAIELKPNYAAAHYQLSRTHESLGDIDKAMESAVNAAKFANRSVDAQFHLARLLYNRNKEDDWENAARIYTAILTQLDANHANTIYSLGILRERQGRLDEARTLYERVLELDPDSEAVKERLRNLPAGTPRRVGASPIEEEEEIEEEEPQTGEAVVE